MSGGFIAVFAVVSLILGVGCWLGWQLLRQNGRMLLRLDELEKRLDEWEFGEPDDEPPSEESKIQNPKSKTDQSLATSAAANGEDDRAGRFANRSLARSKIKRDGLAAGTLAPSFRLPRLDGGELSLEELRGKRVLLVFSDPHCSPCNALAPQLEQFHRENGTKARSPSPPGEGEPSFGVEVVMISRGEPKENHAKVKEHGLTFPVVLQQRWEISRRYAMFATPTAYLIDEAGVTVANVVVGLEPILTFMSMITRTSADRRRDTARAS